MGLTTNAIYALLFAFSLAGAPGASNGVVLAADDGGKPPVAGQYGPDGWVSGWCKDNPDACKERHERREQWCKDNPEKCAKFKERMEWCKKNPEQCKAEREQRHKQWCTDNPEQCAKFKELRETCKADPEKCREERRKMRQEWCANNPDKCQGLHEKMHKGMPDDTQGKPGMKDDSDGNKDSGGSQN